jgi:hypothetical protein
MMNSYGQLVFDPLSGKLIHHPASGKLVYAVDSLPPYPYPQYFDVPLLSSPDVSGTGYLLHWYNYRFNPDKFGTYTYNAGQALASFRFNDHFQAEGGGGGNRVAITVFGPNSWSFASSALMPSRVNFPELFWFHRNTDGSFGDEVAPYSPDSMAADQVAGGPIIGWGDNIGVYQLFTTPYVPGEVSVDGWTAIAPELQIS